MIGECLKRITGTHSSGPRNDRELVDRRAIEASWNYIRRRSILGQTEPFYAALSAALKKLKAPLRKASERMVEGLWNAIGRLLPDFTPKECANFFKAAGYDAT